MAGDEATLTTATVADLPAIRDLLGRCGLPTADLQRERLHNFVAYRADDQLVGVVGIDMAGDIGLLRSLAVAPKFRGRGIAHALWMRAHEDALRRGVRRLYLLTTTAERLFERWGFCRVARGLVPATLQATEEFTSLCPTSAIAMTLELTSGSGR
jgi:amino-acid N-acetyltransferase